jgi:hypothetical protein
MGELLQTLPCCSCRWGETMSLNCGHQRAYCSSQRWYIHMEPDRMTVNSESRRTRRKTCPSATLSTADLTWSNPVANPGFRGNRPATNHLNHRPHVGWDACLPSMLTFETICISHNWENVVKASKQIKLLMFRAVFWVILPCKMIVDRRFRGDDGGSTYLWNVDRQSLAV